MNVYACMFESECMYVYVCICMYVYSYMYVYLYMYVYVSISVIGFKIYIHIHLYTYSTCIYVCTGIYAKYVYCSVFGPCTVIYDIQIHIRAYTAMQVH
jgi:hypothetical protein